MWFELIKIEGNKIVLFRNKSVVLTDNEFLDKKEDNFIQEEENPDEELEAELAV